MSATLGTLLPFFGVLAVGLVLSRTKRFAGAESALTGFVFYVAMPAFLINNLSRADLGSAIPVLPILVATAVAGLVTTLVALTLRPLRGHPGAAEEAGLSAGFANVAYLGIPLTVALIGTEATLAAGLVQLVHNLSFLVAYPLVVAARAGREGSASLGAMVGRVLLRAVLLNPVTFGVAGGLLVAGTGLRLPGPVAGTVEMLAGAAVPAALIAVGLRLGPSLRDLGSGDASLTAVLVATTAKLVVVPAATWAILLPFGDGLDPVWAGALIIMAAMPTSTMAFIVTREHGRDGRTAAATITATTLGCLLTIPLVVALALP